MNNSHVQAFMKVFNDTSSITTTSDDSISVNIFSLSYYLIYKSFTFKRYWPACFGWRARLYDLVSSTVSTTIPQLPFCQIVASNRTHHLHHRWCHQFCHFRWDQTPLVHQSTSPGDCRSYEGWWDQEIPAWTQYRRTANHHSSSARLCQQLTQHSQVTAIILGELWSSFGCDNFHIKSCYYIVNSDAKPNARHFNKHLQRSQ